jgi:hypothetical protein
MGVLVGVLIAILAAAPSHEPRRPPAPPWLAEELPLPLSVKTPEELQLKAVAERQYLIFNLLAGGKVAWDAGDWASAAGKWEALLRLPGLPTDVEAAARPFASEARQRAGGAVGEARSAPAARW